MYKAKQFAVCVVVISLVAIFLLCSRISSVNTEIYEREQIARDKKSKISDDEVKFILARNNELKTVLVWTDPDHDPLADLGHGQEIFIKKKCKVQSCYITRTKDQVDYVTDFDVLLFNGPEIVNKREPILPKSRLPRQKYIYASIESSDYYPICDTKFDGYFNLTWTYKLNSNISYAYMMVKNATGDIIGPNKEMEWLTLDEMKPINDTIKQKLRSKKKLAAWLVSNCNAPSGRDNYVRKVQQQLRKLGSDWTIDVYGNCGTFKCPRKDMPRCLEIFENDYYFYFSFENSMSEDYVTEKILHALQHYAIPVVYGAANYSRFIPDGIYLNAKELGPRELAERMIDIVSDEEKYYEYFKWMNHYSFHYVQESVDTDFHCKLCEAINDKRFMGRTTVIEGFKEWWNEATIRRGQCPPRYLH